MLSELQKRKLTKFFTMHDANCDGSLVDQDFENIVKRLANIKNLGTRSPNYMALQTKFTNTWKALKSGADADRDKSISLEEWFAYYDTILGDEQKYTQEIRSLLSLVLQIFDDNGDGKICQEEWAQLLSTYNVSCLYAPLVFPKLDTNQDGFLTIDEVLQLLQEFFYSDQLDAPGNFMFGPF